MRVFKRRRCVLWTILLVLNGIWATIGYGATDKTDQLIRFADQYMEGWLFQGRDFQRVLAGISDVQMIKRIWVALALQKKGAISDAEFGEFTKAINAAEAQAQEAKAKYGAFKQIADMVLEALMLDLKAEEQAGTLKITFPPCPDKLPTSLQEYLGSDIEDNIVKNWQRFPNGCSTKFSEFTGVLGQQLAALQAQNDQLRSEVETLRQQTQEARQQLQQKEFELATVQGEQLRLQEQVAALQQENQGLKTDIEQLKRQSNSPLPWVFVGILALVLAGLLWSRRSQSA